MKPLRILIVEDHQMVANSMRRMFEGRGHGVEVLSSLDRVEDISDAMAGPPEVIIVDRIIGDQNGWEWVKEIMDSGLDVRVILTSAGEDLPLFPALFFLKGSDPSILIAMVER